MLSNFLTHPLLLMCTFAEKSNETWLSKLLVRKAQVLASIKVIKLFPGVILSFDCSTSVGEDKRSGSSL